MNLLPLFVQIMPHRTDDSKRRMRKVVFSEESLGFSAGDDAGALGLEEGARVALEDANVVAQAFKDEAGEEAAEGAAALGVGG